MPERNIHVSKHKRYDPRIGKNVSVSSYKRKQKINPKVLKQYPSAKAKKQMIERYLKTHPDALSNARLTFMYPNKYWAENQDKCDVLFLDAKEAPKVDTLPKSGVPGQVVNYKGKNYIADKEGNFKQIQMDIRDFGEPVDETEINVKEKSITPQRLKGLEKWDNEAGYIDPNLETFSSAAEYRGAKSWLAIIKGEHDKFKFDRQFLSKNTIDGTQKIHDDLVHEGMILEKGSNYYTGSGRKRPKRTYYKVVKKADDNIYLEEFKTESEVLKTLKKREKNT